MLKSSKYTPVLIKQGSKLSKISDGEYQANLTDEHMVGELFELVSSDSKPVSTIINLMGLKTKNLNKLSAMQSVTAMFASTRATGIES